MERKTTHWMASVIGIVLMLVARLLLPPSLFSGLIGVAGLFVVIWVIWDSGKIRACPIWKRCAAIALVCCLGFVLFP